MANGNFLAEGKEKRVNSLMEFCCAEGGNEMAGDALFSRNYTKTIQVFLKIVDIFLLWI